MIDWFTYAETEYGIVLNQTARNRFELYYRELVEWNSRKFVRISVQAYNTQDDLDALYDGLHRLLPQVRP